MKKNLFYFLAASLVAFSSCSKDDDDSSTVLLLPKTEKYTYASHPDDSSTISYVYDGNKIVSLTYDDGSKTVFTYAGDFISKAVYTESYEGATHSTTTTFAYENNKLKSYLEVSSDNSSSKKKTYVYNANGTISTVTVLINPVTQDEIQDSSSVLTLDSNGNIIKAEFDDYSNTIEYDTKYSPFKNVLGYTLLLDSDIFDKEANSLNNVVKITEKTGEVTVYENTYNSNNYLLKSVSGDETYEYTY
ncbi:hypothetical protein [Flavobacterium sp. FlaQc-48]|uniref:hypothetical protein n=1 Tax=Flavobacterium sp. FlaQc-48 TaxID=3374181 RepID=UPI003756FA8B